MIKARKDTIKHMRNGGKGFTETQTVQKLWRQYMLLYTVTVILSHFHILIVSLYSVIQSTFYVT